MTEDKLKSFSARLPQCKYENQHAKVADARASCFQQVAALMMEVHTEVHTHSCDLSY